MAANPALVLQPEIKAQVRNAVVHNLVKLEAGAFDVEHAGNELVITATVSKVVGRLISEYSRRTGKAHGQFEADEVNFPVQQHVRNFCKENGTSFMELTAAMMATLRVKATKTAAGSGHVVFAMIDDGGIGQLLVAIVTEEWGAALGKDMGFAEAEILDLKGFRFAGRVDLTDWAKGGDKYLSFLKGRNNEVSAYFKAFLGCDSSVTDAAETRTLKTALEAFAKESGLDETKRAEFFNKAYDICNQLAKDGDPIHLETFANEMWPVDPPALLTVLSRPELKLTDGFVPDKRGLKAFVQFGGKTKSWEVKFARDAILNKEVVFNEDESLTLHNLPPELKIRLRNEVKDQEDEEQDDA